MNRIDRTVDIYIGGKARKMRFNINSIVELERRIPEKNIFVLMQKGAFPLESLIAATWAGLRYQDKFLDIKTVTRWVDEYLAQYSYQKLFALVYGAIGLSGLMHKDVSLFEDIIKKANALDDADEEEAEEGTDPKN